MSRAKPTPAQTEALAAPCGYCGAPAGTWCKVRGTTWWAEVLHRRGVREREVMWTPAWSCPVAGCDKSPEFHHRQEAFLIGLLVEKYAEVLALQADLGEVARWVDDGGAR